MSRYIEFNDAVKVMACEMYAEAQSQGYDVDGIEDFMPEAKAWLNDAPSIDIEPKRGEWKPFDLKWGRSIWYCTACEEGVEVPCDIWTHKPIYNFCPNCGADMRNCSEKPNNCEPKICDTCRYYNSNIPCGSTPSACKEADKFAEEFVDGLKKLKPKVEPQTSPTISKMEQVETEQITSKLIDIENSAVSGYESTMSQPKSKLKDEPRTEECEEPNYYDPALWE